MTEEFLKCVDASRNKITCKLGLWSVESDDKERLKAEAMHYWRQYRSDGEYHELIGGPTPLEILMRGRV